jgi:hypothetical protein
MQRVLAALMLIPALLLDPRPGLAAIGCTLSSPARDLKYLYPDMTTYKEELKEFPRMHDGAALFAALRARLGSSLDPIYETYETPYTVYSVFKGESKIGVVHGVNVPGKGGVIQVFLAMNPVTAEITNFFFQRLESPVARELRGKDFRAQFAGLTLGDFYKHDYYEAVQPGAKADKLATMKPPSIDSSGHPDHAATLRAIKKNLILLDFFVFERRFEPHFDRARQAAEKAKARKG